MGESKPETVRIKCECGAKGSVPTSFVGRRVRCKACGKRIDVPSPKETQSAWHYMKDNQQVGPVPESGMQELFDAGVIGAQTLVWTEPMKEWIFASNVEVFRVEASSVRPSTGMSPTSIVLLVLIPIAVIALVVVLGIFAAIALPALAKSRESARRAACVNNLRQMGLVMNLFANENRDEYPRIDDVKGNLIFEGSLVYPSYLSDLSNLGCPGDPGFDPATTFRLKDNSLHPDFAAGAPHADCITSESYIYLGWLVMNEQEGLAAIEAYQNASTEELGEYLRVPEGRGNDGSDRINRLRTGADRFYITDVRNVSNTPDPGAIPVMWEWPLNHAHAGGNVLYLDGHIEFIRYPDEFPMTKKFIGALRLMESQFPPDVLPIVDK